MIRPTVNHGTRPLNGGRAFAHLEPFTKLNPGRTLHETEHEGYSITCDASVAGYPITFPGVG